MSKLLDLLKRTAGEASLYSGLGFWRQKVSVEVDALTARPVSSILIVENVTDLRALIGSGSLPTVMLRWYSNTTGVGGGLFVWDTAPGVDNGGTRFNIGGFGSLGAGWQRIWDGDLDTDMFGVGSTADDSIAVQSAIDTAAALGVALHALGDATITTALTVASTASAPLVIYGDGHKSHWDITLPGTNTVALAATGANFSNFLLRDIRITGTFSRGVSLVANAGSNVRVKRVAVSGHTAFSAGVTLAGIIFGGLDDVWITGNEVSGGGYDNGDGSGQGYDIVKNSGAVQRRIHVLGNKVTGSKTVLSIALFDCADSECRGNYVDQGNTPGSMGPPVTFGYGITMYDVVGASTCRGNKVTHNTVVNCAGMGIYMEQQYDSEVHDNICRDTCKQITEPSLPLAAIVTNGAPGSITDNVVKTTTGATHGVAFTHPTTVVTGNTTSNVSAGVALYGNAHRSTITGNTFVDTVHGVLVDGINPIGLTIIGNGFQNAMAPLSVQPGASLTGSTFSHNTIDGAQVGVLLSAGISNTIQSNKITGSSSWGIQVLSDLNDVLDNTVTGSTADGGILYQGNLGRVEGNTATGNVGTPISITGTDVLSARNRIVDTEAFSGPLPSADGSRLAFATGIGECSVGIEPSEGGGVSNMRYTGQDAEPGSGGNGGAAYLQGGGGDGAGLGGPARIIDGDGNLLFEAHDGKLALFGGPPAVQPTIVGDVGSITDANAKAVIESIITALANISAAVNGTTGS